MAHGFTSRLLVGLAEYLAAQGVADWRPTGAYQTSETGIVIRGIPQTPDRIITLAPYPVGTSLPGLADHQLAVQLRPRGTGDPQVCDDLADAIFDALDGAHDLLLGDVPLVQAWRQSYTSLGDDDNGRWQRSENYYFDTMRPTNLNTD